METERSSKQELRSAAEINVNSLIRVDDNVKEPHDRDQGHSLGESCKQGQLGRSQQTVSNMVKRGWVVARPCPEPMMTEQSQLSWLCCPHKELTTLGAVTGQGLGGREDR